MSREREHTQTEVEAAADPRPPAAAPALHPVVLAAVVVAVLLLRISPWVTADLWYDEIITLTDYAVGPPDNESLWRVFRVYPVANNHILFSALLWVWVRCTDMTTAEWLLRLPSVVISAATLVWVGRRWRPWLGERLAWTAALLFAASPVFAPFAYDLRGYPLSMFLGAVAVTGVMEATDPATRTRGLHRCGLTALLLPLTIPTNAILPVAHLLFLATVLVGERQPRPWRALLSLWPIALGLGLGAGYYLTIWPQFAAAARETSGWPSAWAVCRHGALALAAHLAPLALLLLPTPAAPRPAAGPAPAWRRPEARTVGCLLLTAALPAGTMLLALHSAPFPRTFLVLLPTVTFAALCLLRTDRPWSRARTALVTIAILANSQAWVWTADALTARRLQAGDMPQDLLQQYYRGSTCFSDLGVDLSHDPRTPHTVVLTGFFDFPAFRYYWALRCGQPVEHVLSPDRDPGGTWAREFADGTWELAVVAAAPEQARRLLADAGLAGEPVLEYQADARGFYRVALPLGPPPPPAPP